MEDFGAGYRDRNAITPPALATNTSLFSKVFGHTEGIRSVCELGCNIGVNLASISGLLPECALTGIEINAASAEQARANVPKADIVTSSILDWDAGSKKFDLVFTKGVLIHINPDYLKSVYELMEKIAARYVLIVEYYNPTPVSIPYRGHQDRLFKRDFAGEFLDSCPGFSVASYGFVWRRDPNFPQDDATWFLLRRDSE